MTDGAIDTAGEDVRLAGIVKRFGETIACDGASLSAPAGAIGALVGENGAGKTTLMRILAGEIQPDEGTMHVGSRAVRFASPREAWAMGVGMVEQEPRVIPALSVFENVVLGGDDGGWLRARRLAAERARKILAGLGLNAPIHAAASTLAPPERQRLAIARALYRGARTLILDEPTSLLGPVERGALFGIMRELAGRGAAVIFISHKLAEVFEAADTITVLRRGVTVLSRRTAETSPSEIAAAMVGADFNSEAGMRGVPGEIVVRLSGVATAGEGRGALKGVSLEVRRGEILGIAGVAGNGQRDLSDAVTGLVQPSAGEVRHPFGQPGIASVGEDVDAMDIVGPMTAWENRILGREGQFAGWWGIDRRRSRADMHRLAREFDIRGDAEWPMSAFSGGNRQRLVLARELDSAPDVLVAEEPTRGLDIMGAELVRQRIREAATSGSAVLLISYDLDELYAVADRILVISSGRLLEPSSQPPLRAEIGQLMGR